MSKVLSNPLIHDIVPKTIDIQVVKSIAMQNEIIVGGLIKSLEDMKNPSFVAKLTTKHDLLITVVNTMLRTLCHIRKNSCSRCSPLQVFFCNAMAKAYGFE
jgi:hypothetical protein